MKNYSYPIQSEWSHEEMTTVISFLVLVEQAYEQSVEVRLFLNAYKSFKEIVRSIGEEKRLGKEFEEVSGYSVYRTVKAAKEATTKTFTMKG